MWALEIKHPCKRLKSTYTNTLVALVLVTISVLLTLIQGLKLWFWQPFIVPNSKLPTSTIETAWSTQQHASSACDIEAGSSRTVGFGKYYSCRFMFFLIIYMLHLGFWSVTLFLFCSLFIYKLYDANKKTKLYKIGSITTS